jgi:hypothetical protein
LLSVFVWGPSLLAVLICALFRCTSAELFFHCRGSVAAPRTTAWASRSNNCEAQRAASRATAWAPQSSTCDAQRAAPRAMACVPRSSTCDEQRAAPRATAWAPRSSTYSAPRVAAWAPRPSTCDAQRSNGLGNTAKYLQRTTSGAAAWGLGTTIKYLRRTTSRAAGNGLGRYRQLLIYHFKKSAPLSPCFVGASFAIKQNSTSEVQGLGAPCVWGARVCSLC